MKGIHPLQTTWIDDNTSVVFDPDTGMSVHVTARQKTNMFVGGHPVKGRLFVNTAVVEQLAGTDNKNKCIKWVKEHYQPVLCKILNEDVELKFSQYAGCSCGCSPGFTIEGKPIPFNVWFGDTTIDLTTK